VDAINEWWPSRRREELALSQPTRDYAIKIASDPLSRGRSPFTVAAVALYLGAGLSGEHVSQRELAWEFGVSEVSIRNFLKAYEEKYKHLLLDVKVES
jgi:transcription initiation factor TFIIIB Brf1 subunit/transcription initiation factor TFIIB